MTAETLSQAQAAALAGVTTRRLRQMAHEPNPPAQDAAGRYPAAAFSRWLAAARRQAPVPQIDPGDQLLADVSAAFSKLCGCALESDEPRDTYLGLCLQYGLTKTQAIVAFSLIGFPLAIVGAEASENPDWGIELPPDSFYTAAMRAVGAGKVAEFVAEHWPDKPTRKRGAVKERP